MSFEQTVPEGGTCEPDAEPAPRILLPAIAGLIGLSDAERALEITADRTILYPAMVKLRERARWMGRQARTARAPGLMVSSNPGNGKSSLALYIERQFKIESGNELNTVLISLAGAENARAVYGRILVQLGSPARVSHRLSDREFLVIRLLREANCKLILLDEMQDVGDSDNERERKRVLRCIKHLMNTLQLPVMVFGTGSTADWFKGDPHLRARFSTVELPQWTDPVVLLGFLKAYEQALPLRNPSDLAQLNVARRLIQLSGGVLDNIVARIKNAALLAIVEKTERITPDMIERGEFRPDKCFL